MLSKVSAHVAMTFSALRTIARWVCPLSAIWIRVSALFALKFVRASEYTDMNLSPLRHIRISIVRYSQYRCDLSALCNIEVSICHVFDISI